MAPRLLLTSVVGPFGVADGFAEGIGSQMELLNNQITRGQGVHSPRMFHRSFGLYLLARNISVPTTVLDFPTWRQFRRELRGGYSHVGISFTTTNAFKARRMAEYVRTAHPGMRILLGGYGTAIPDLASIVPHDEACRGEGIAWLRRYFGEDPEAPIEHPVLGGHGYQYLYGVRRRAKGAVIIPGLGCSNGCDFCITSHKFGRTYLPLLKSGKEIFEACRRAEREIGARSFTMLDENFLKRPDDVRELLREMETQGKPYVFDVFASAETVTAMGADFLARLGVRLLWLGVEGRYSRYGKMAGVDAAGLVRGLQEQGISVVASVMLFQDYHTGTGLDEDIDWAVGLGSDLLQFMNYTPLPSTALWKKLEQAGTLVSVPWSRRDGVHHLGWSHPHWRSEEDFPRKLAEAFARKYRVGGPAILNMAITAARGFVAQRDAMATRRDRGETWNASVGRYEATGDGAPDAFMERRVEVLRRLAERHRPVLRAARAFAPNAAARRKAADAAKLFDSAFGTETFASRLGGLVVLPFAVLEQARILWARAAGNGELVRQPPLCRVAAAPRASPRACRASG